MVRVAGEIDLSTAGAFDHGLRLACSAIGPSGMLVVDLREVEFLGAAGLHVLCRARERCARRGVTMASVAAHAAVTAPIRLTGLSGVVGLTPRFPDGDGG